MLNILECEHNFCEIEQSVLKCTKCGKVEVDEDNYDIVLQDGSIWIPEERNDMLIGKIVDIVDGIYGKNYIIQKSNGNKVTTPSHKILQELLDKTVIGNHIIIQYKGSKNIGRGSDLVLYKVWKKI